MTAEFFDQRRNSVSCRRWTVDYIRHCHCTLCIWWPWTLSRSTV